MKLAQLPARPVLAGAIGSGQWKVNDAGMCGEMAEKCLTAASLCGVGGEKRLKRECFAPSLPKEAVGGRKPRRLQRRGNEGAVKVSIREVFFPYFVAKPQEVAGKKYTSRQ
jgi:hypothetical protein